MIKPINFFTRRTQSETNKELIIRVNEIIDWINKNNHEYASIEDVVKASEEKTRSENVQSDPETRSENVHSKVTKIKYVSPAEFDELRDQNKIEPDCFYYIVEE